MPGPGPLQPPPVAGGWAAPFQIVSAAYAATPQDGIIYCDATAGPFTVTIPAAASVAAGTMLSVRKRDSSANAITIARTGSDTFNSLTSISLASQFEAATLISDGRNSWLYGSDSAAGVPTTLQDLSNVVLTNPQPGDGIIYDPPNFINQPLKSVNISLLSGFTPTGTGPDAYEATVPYDPIDGITVIVWNIRRLTFRVSGAAGAPEIKAQKSTVGDAAFGAGTDIGSVVLASGGFEAAVTAALGQVSSGDKLRANVVTHTAATGWSFDVLLGA